MKYGVNIMKEIVAELEKVPIIRHVCSKVGIDHSTFYRWMMIHPTFNKNVLVALYTGRRRVNDAAESVILSEIQKNDLKAAVFWLSHNEPRFMTKEKGAYYRSEMMRFTKILDTEEPSDYPSFEKIFILFDEYEKDYDTELAHKIIRPFVELLCHNDSKLIDVFFASYVEWKNNLTAVEEKAKKIEVDLYGDILDSPDQSVIPIEDEHNDN